MFQLEFKSELLFSEFTITKRLRIFYTFLNVLHLVQNRSPVHELWIVNQYRSNKTDRSRICSSLHRLCSIIEHVNASTFKITF